jgi:hypothetical protein
MCRLGPDRDRNEALEQNVALDAEAERRADLGHFD